MARPWEMQPDESYPIGLLRQVADGFERLDHVIRGNGGEGLLTRMSHCERTDREMAAKLDAFMTETRDAIRDIRGGIAGLSETPTEVEKLAALKVRWEVVLAATAFGGMLLNFAMEIWR